MLDAQSRDPEVVLWNGLALLPQSEAQLGVDLGGGDRDVQNRAASDERLNLSEVLGSATRSPLPGVDALELTIDDLLELLSVLRRKRAGNLRERRRLHLDVHGQCDLVMLDKPFGAAERPEYAVLEYGWYGLAHLHNPSRSGGGLAQELK